MVKKVVETKLTGFFDFIRGQGVIGLAIGFMLGDKVKAVVNSLVNDIINPFLGVILGSGGTLQDATVSVGGVIVHWGHFVSVVIDFMIVAAVIFFIFKGMGLDKIDKKKE